MLVLFLGLFPILVQAAVVDDLSCELKYGGAHGYPKVTTTMPVRGIRIPRSTGVSNEVFTDARSDMSFRVAPLSEKAPSPAEIGFHFSYTHAMKLDSQGAPILAYHWRCVDLTLVLDDGPLRFECLPPPPNPFDDPSGAWLKVRIEEGIPRFGIKEFQFDVAETPIGAIHLNCIRNGTYR